MKILLFFLFTLINVTVFSQNTIDTTILSKKLCTDTVTILRIVDTVRIKHTNYTTVFSKSKHYPIVVEWWLTKKMLDCTPAKRHNDFAKDVLLPKETDLSKDYYKSGLDRGHMCPDLDNLCQGDTVQSECFYYSNMSPQYHSLNAGDWKSLELYCNTLAVTNDSIHIWAGSIGEAKKIQSVSVPTQCWKVFYIKKLNEWHEFIFDNTNNKPTGFKVHEVPVGTIEKITSLQFK